LNPVNNTYLIIQILAKNLKELINISHTTDNSTLSSKKIKVLESAIVTSTKGI